MQQPYFLAGPLRRPQLTMASLRAAHLVWRQHSRTLQILQILRLLHAIGGSLSLRLSPLFRTSDTLNLRWDLE